MSGTRNFPSETDQVGLARDCVLHHLPPDARRYDDTKLCTSEVVTNAIRHAAPHRRSFGFEVSVEVTVEEVTVEVRDGGSATTPTIRGGTRARRTNGRG